MDSKGKKRTVVDPVLFSNSKNPKVTIITEYLPSKTEVSSLKRFFDRYMQGTEYQILSPFIFNLSNKEQANLEERDAEESSGGKRNAKKTSNQSVTEFYKKESIDLTKYIPAYSNVITFKKSLYAISGDALRHDYFHDTLLEMTSFFAPALKCRVYPIASVSEIISRGTFERRFALRQIEKAKKESEYFKRIPKETVIVVDDPEAFFKETMDYDGITAFDTETNGLDFRKHRPFCATISFDGRIGYYLDWDKSSIPSFEKWVSNKKLVMANGKFDLKMLYASGVDISNINFYADTMNLHQLINEMQGKSLKTQAWLFDYVGGYEDALVEYRKKYGINDYSKIPKSVLIEYAVQDTLLTYRIYNFLIEKVRLLDEIYPQENGWSLEKLFFDIVMPSVRMFTDIEIRGMYVDIKKLEEIGRQIKKEIADIKEELAIAFEVSRDYDFASFDKLGILLKAKNWENFGCNKKGIYKTGDDQLQRWVKAGRKEASLILKFREKSTLFNTFIGERKSIKGKPTGMWKYIRKHSDGYRIHGQFAVMMADSLRLKSRNPNMQNLPAKGEGARFLKQIFIPPNKDFVFVSADASGLQLRIACMDAQEETMKDIFINHGGDIHSRTALSALMNNRISFEDFMDRKNNGDAEVKAYRTKAKGLNFLLLFGGSVGLAYRNFVDTEWSEKECEDFVKQNNLQIEKYQNQYNIKYTVAKFLHGKFFETYPNLINWKEKNIAHAKRFGFVRSMYGSFRRTPYLQLQGNDDNGARTSNYESICLNSPVQTEETVMMQRSMIKLHEWLKSTGKKSYIFSNIHDAIELYVHREELSSVVSKIKEIFEIEYPEYGGVPFEIEGNVADYYDGELWDMGHDWSKYLQRRRVAVN